jgi:hypothetical protein
MRQCPQCHRVYANEAAFCLEDGTPLTDTRDSEQTVVRTAYLSTPTTAVPTKKKGRSLNSILVIVAVGSALAVGGLLLGMNLNLSSETAATAPPRATPLPVDTPTPGRPRRTRPTPTPEPTINPTYNPTPPPTAVPITPEFVQLEPGQYRWYPFSIGSNGGRVEGTFTAQGGIGDDIYIFVIPQNELTAFRNNYSFNQYYDSGKVHSDTFSRSLSSGNYFVIIKSPTPFTVRRIRCNLNAVSN